MTGIHCLPTPFSPIIKQTNSKFMKFLKPQETVHLLIERKVQGGENSEGEECDIKEKHTII